MTARTGFRLVPLTSDLDEAVAAFNRRLAEGGSTLSGLDANRAPFPTMRSRNEDPIDVEQYAAMIGDEVRGGVIIKTMPFRVADRIERVSFYKYPLSEGIVNPRFGMVGFMIQKEVVRRHPLVYGLGGGSLDLPVSKLMIAGGWWHAPVPFHFAVLRASPFLRNIVPLRNRTSTRWAADVAAATGLGSIGLGLFRAAQRIRGRFPKSNEAEVRIDEFDAWGDWADDVWNAHQGHYAMVGERSRRVLSSLYPSEEEHFIKLRVSRPDGSSIGWIVLSVAKLNGHSYFGDLTLGTLIDMFAAPGDAVSVASAGLIECRRRGADVAVVNHAAEAWNQAFRQVGMVPWRTNFFLFLAPPLRQRLDPIASLDGRLYFNRGDGDGPIHLW